MMLRCTLDGLLLDAAVCPESAALVAYDGDECFALEALEVFFYELVAATAEEIAQLERAGYRLLRYAADFRFG
jgi:hypothetical protein